MKIKIRTLSVILGVGLICQSSLALDIKSFNLTESTGHPYDANDSGGPKTEAQDAVDYLYDLGVRHILLTPEAIMANLTASEIVFLLPISRFSSSVAPSVS